jgi:hypothetical protein
MLVYKVSRPPFGTDLAHGSDLKKNFQNNLDRIARVVYILIIVKRKADKKSSQTIKQMKI